ncbi:hypothetical protein M1N51_01970 [Peptococcaceae bacterium]|nr:hypothetical protein [Peptococcaceae bacterium]
MKWADYITEKIKVVAELKPYLEKTVKSLNLGNIFMRTSIKLLHSNDMFGLKTVG